MQQSFDDEGHFFRTVSIAGYADIVKRPIHLGEILSKLRLKKYDRMGRIQYDINRVWSNCYTFNGQPDLRRPSALNGFANFGRRLQLKLDEYLRRFKLQLKEKGYVDERVAQRKRKREPLRETTRNNKARCKAEAEGPPKKKVRFVLDLTA